MGFVYYYLIILDDNKTFLNGSFIQCPIQTYTQDLTSHTRPDRHVPYPLISLCNMKSPQWTVMQSGKEEEDIISLSLSLRRPL